MQVNLLYRVRLDMPTLLRAKPPYRARVGGGSRSTGGRSDYVKPYKTTQQNCQAALDA